MDYNDLKEKEVINRRGYLTKAIEVPLYKSGYKDSVISIPRFTQFTVMDKKYKFLIKIECGKGIEITCRTAAENLKIYGL